MTNIEIVNKLARERFVEGVIDRITENGKKAKDPESLNDLAQDLYVSLLEDKKVPGIFDEGHITFYVTRMVMNNIMSSTSPYYRIYLRPLVLGNNYNDGYKDINIDYGDDRNGQS